MATVADIEPASLAITPGQAEVFALTVRNDGDEVEAYHLSVVDDAVDQVVIEPETLLVHPGETGTATATITLEHTGRWTAGDLIVRFHIVPAVHPDEFVVVEAIATIQSFSEVAAMLSPTTLEGRRGGSAEIAIANSGNVNAEADVAVSAGELAVAIDHAHATVPAGSTEDVELHVRVNRLQWRGEPVAHPFTVTVAPEGDAAISLQGTFTQLPVVSGWALKAALGVAAALVLLGAVWLSVLAWGNVSGRPVADTSTPTETATAEPVAVSMAFDVDHVAKAGDAAVLVLGAEVDGAPDDAVLAVAVEWPDELTLADSTCEGWVGPEIDRELQGRPRSGDECLIDPSRSRSEAELTFSTPPAGFGGDVTAAATRLVTIEDGEVQEIEPEAEADFGEAKVTIDVQPYPFWMEVAVSDPTHDGRRDATITVHRTLLLDGNDQAAEMAFDLHWPEFADLTDVEGCDGYDSHGAVCTLFFPSDLASWTVTASFDAQEDARDAGLVSVRGVSLSVGHESVPQSEVGTQVRGAEDLLVAADGLFAVDVTLDPDEAQPGESVTATVEVTQTGFPADVKAFRDGSWMLGLELSWPEALVLNGEPQGCASFVGRVCELPGPDVGRRAVVTMRFTVADDAFENGEVRANGAALTYDPSTDADRLDRRDQATISLPPRWIQSDAETFFPD